MSPHKYAAPLCIALEPSRRLALFLLPVVTGAIACACLADLHWVARCLLLVAIGAITYREYRNHFGPRRVAHLLWDVDGQWKLTCADGTEHAALLRGDSILASGLMLLNFQVGSRVPSVVLLPDVADAETLRRLRVRLRLEGAKGSVSETTGN